MLLQPIYTFIPNALPNVQSLNTDNTTRQSLNPSSSQLQQQRTTEAHAPELRLAVSSATRKPANERKRRTRPRRGLGAAGRRRTRSPRHAKPEAPSTGAPHANAQPASTRGEGGCADARGPGASEGTAWAWMAEPEAGKGACTRGPRTGTAVGGGSGLHRRDE